jgi:hypothetical protein
MVDFTINEPGANDAFGGESASVPVIEATPLIALRQRRQELIDEMYMDLRVPRWDNPEVYVRFKPVSASRLNTAIERRRKQKAENWSILANADMLVDACVGVYASFDGGQTQYSLRLDDAEGSWTKFDHDLAAALGLEDAKSQAETCLGLYLTEGDLIDAANRLFKWSGIVVDEADETF